MKDILSRLIKLLLSLLLVLAIAAGASLPPSPQKAIHATPATRQITDAAGRVVKIPYVVNRIADAWPANAGMVLMLGGADKLVGITQQAQNQPWLRKLYPRIANVPVIINAANDLNIETLINTHPDVVLMSYAAGMPPWIDKAAAANIPVVMMPATTFKDIMTTIRMTGEILGPSAEAIAADWLKYYNRNIIRIRAVTESIPREQRLRVLHTLRPNILSVDGVGGLVNDWINNSGGINVAVEMKGNAGTATMEQILKWNPDVIICGTEPNVENVQKIMTDPQWSSLKAVKDKKVYCNPTGVYLWDRHSAEGALQILWAAKILYPDKFRDVDVKAETKSFFARFFHYNLTDNDFDSIMNAKAP